MKRSVFVLPLVVCALCAGLASAAAAPDLQASFDSLLDAERSFSKQSVDKGLVSSFSHFAPGAVLLRPTPDRGAQWLEQMGKYDSIVAVTWEPREAILSRSGDFGWVTGPWTVRRKGDPTPVKTGEFLSIWRKGPDGAWKVAADTAISDKGVLAPEALAAPALKTPAKAGGDAASTREAVLEIDRRLSAAAAQADAAQYLPFLSDGTLWLRMFERPVLGMTGIRDAVKQLWTPLNLKQMGGDVSSAGDMAYTYGVLEDPEKHGWTDSTYLRIWERKPDGSWIVAVDLVNWAMPHQVPPEPPKNPG